MSDDKNTEAEAVPASQRSSWSSFLKSIASFSGDLSSMTAPPFILSPVSLTEFPAYWCERPELFAAIADGKTEEDRAMRVLKWFISTLKGQYTSRNESMGSEKKPLNPVLGELFYGSWPTQPGETGGETGPTTLLVEQVSHHPPITAYRIANEQKGLVLEGHNAQKTSFSGGSIIVKQVGHAILTVTLPSQEKEEYLITLPRLRIDGLWYGSPYIELSETSWIAGSSGWVASIEYKGKGYFGGKPHSFKATLTPPGVTPPLVTSTSSSSSGLSSPANGWGLGRSASGKTKEEKGTIVVEGLWHLTSKTSTGVPFHDVTPPKHEVHVSPLEEQGAWESRNLWAAVAKGIREGDFEGASREKGRIENEQRQRRKDEQAAGSTWSLRHFKHVDSDPVYEHLGKLFKATPATEDAYVFLDNGDERNWEPRV